MPSYTETEEREGGAVVRARKDKPAIPLQENLKSYGMIAPYMILFFTFSVLPVLIAIIFGFTYFNMLEMPRFVGLDNYIRMLSTDDLFMTALRNTLVMSLVIGPGGYLLCMFFAWMINELPDKLRALMTFLFYVPSISGNMYLIWKVLFGGDMYGYINTFLLQVGIINQPIVFLKNSDYMMGIVLLVSLWGSLGTSFLTFIAGFKGIDTQYYEAGMVDGISNRWQELWFITLPLLRPQMMFAAVMSISGAFGVGAISTELCGFPSTDYAVHTLMNHLTDYGTIKYEMGYACALATVLFLMMVGFNMIVQRVIAHIGK